MLKPLTFSVSLAIALGACNLGFAGHHGVLPSGQCEGPSPQSVVASPQSEGCGDVCGPVKKHFKLCDLFKPKPKCYTYEWVLKKKRCGGLFGHKSCGAPACDSCGTLPSGQYASPQGEWGSPQYAPAAYSAPQAAPYSAPQIAPAGQVGDIAPAAPAAPAAPPAPPAAPQASNGVLFLSPAGN